MRQEKQQANKSEGKFQLFQNSGLGLALTLKLKKQDML